MHMKNLPDPDFINVINKLVKKHGLKYDKEDRFDAVVYDLAFALSELEPNGKNP